MSAWTPLTQGYNYGEGADPIFADLPRGQAAQRNDAGEWGYWKDDTALPADWLHAEQNPWQSQIDATRSLVGAALPSFWGNALSTVSAGFDPTRGLYSVPTRYGSEQEMLADPRWWGAQDLRPEVRAALINDPRAGYASLTGAYYAADPTPQMAGLKYATSPMPQGYAPLTGRTNDENLFPIIGAEGGYRSMQDLQWLPGYGFVAPRAAYIPEQNEDYAKLAIGLAAAAATGGAMAGAFAAPGTAGAAMPAAGKAAWGLAQAAMNRNPLSAVGALGNLGAAADLWSPQVGSWIGRGAGALGALNSAAGDPLGVRGWFGGAQPASTAPGAGASLAGAGTSLSSAPVRSGLLSLRVPSLAMKSGLI